MPLCCWCHWLFIILYYYYYFNLKPPVYLPAANTVLCTETHLSSSLHTVTSGTLLPPCALSMYTAAHPLAPFTFQSQIHIYTNTDTHKHAWLPSGISVFSHTHPLVSKPYDRSLHGVFGGIRLYMHMLMHVGVTAVRVNVPACIP